MGWFWSDPSLRHPSAPHPLPHGNAQSPPPGCPMHKPLMPSMPTPPSKVLPTPDSSSTCPYTPPSPQSADQGATPSYISKLNPLNYMPSNISNERHSSNQSTVLPLERETSTIPRGDGPGTWEYPSPQQMYNAMLRKGYTDTPAEHVESMVAVHNFLNEGAWEEIKEWERRFAEGLGKGWEYCRLGELNASRRAEMDAFRRQRAATAVPRDGSSAVVADLEPKLVRFMGRPNEPTPKARMLGFMAWLYPAQFPKNPPFDRHDWYVQRQTSTGRSKEVRYVIDYYSGPPEPTGEPVFYLDVRPAVDGPTSACERMLRWGGDVWYRASGGSVREEMQRQKAREAR